MSHFPNHSYCGQYYFNPQWIQPETGGSSPSVVYNNVVNFTVGPDGTHYFHQTYSGQFVAPPGPTTDMKMVRLVRLMIVWPVTLTMCLKYKSECNCLVRLIKKKLQDKRVFSMGFDQI